MRKLSLAVFCLFVASMATGCMYVQQQVSLKEAAASANMVNVTTGDGTFENYQAVDHQQGCELGIAVGIPFIGKFVELFPVQTNQQMLNTMAQKSAANGANAMINVSVPREHYLGFPFFIVGLYLDHTEGTGIKTK
jgi:hypothetical protein